MKRLLAASLAALGLALACVTAQAAWPELWPDNWSSLAPSDRLAYAGVRQTAIDRMAEALKAVAEASDEEVMRVKRQREAFNELRDLEADLDEKEAPAGKSSLTAEEVTIKLPEDAAMVQQVLATIVYVDHDGQTAYDVRTMGEGLRTTWLGMNVLTQDYLLKPPGSTGSGWKES